MRPTSSSRSCIARPADPDLGLAEPALVLRNQHWSRSRTCLESSLRQAAHHRLVPGRGDGRAAHARGSITIGASSMSHARLGTGLFSRLIWATSGFKISTISAVAQLARIPCPRRLRRPLGWLSSVRGAVQRRWPRLKPLSRESLGRLRICVQCRYAGLRPGQAAPSGPPRVAG